jgi:hypothetical protein
MRYHRAPLISGPEAAFLLERNNAGLGHAVVVSCDGQWYDVRALSSKELEEFTDDLARKRLVGMSVTN